MQELDKQLWPRFTALKQLIPGLQTWISVGGWSFSDPGPTRHMWSYMTQQPSSRQNLPDNLIQFMETYGFDGVDLDWEYPQATDRDGAPADTKNYAALVREMRILYFTTLALYTFDGSQFVIFHSA